MKKSSAFSSIKVGQRRHCIVKKKNLNFEHWLEKYI